MEISKFGSNEGFYKYRCSHPGCKEIIELNSTVYEDVYCKEHIFIIIGKHKIFIKDILFVSKYNHIVKNGNKPKKPYVLCIDVYKNDKQSRKLFLFKTNKDREWIVKDINKLKKG